MRSWKICRNKIINKRTWVARWSFTQPFTRWTAIDSRLTHSLKRYATGKLNQKQMERDRKRANKWAIRRDREKDAANDQPSIWMQTTVSEETHSKNMWLIETTTHLNEWTRIVNDTPTHIWFSYTIFNSPYYKWTSSYKQCSHSLMTSRSLPLSFLRTHTHTYTTNTKHKITQTTEWKTVR